MILVVSSIETDEVDLMRTTEPYHHFDWLSKGFEPQYSIRL